MLGLARSERGAAEAVLFFPVVLLSAISAVLVSVTAFWLFSAISLPWSVFSEASSCWWLEARR